MAYVNKGRKLAREAKIRDAVEGWRRSGLTQVDYCKERGLTLGTFRGWSKEYRAKEREEEQSKGQSESSGRTAKCVKLDTAPLQCEDEAERTEEKPDDAVQVGGPRTEEACQGELVIVDVVNRPEGRGNHERYSRPEGPGEQTRVMRVAAERGRNESPVEIELPSGIVIRLGPGSEAWRVAGIVREIQNTC